MKISITKYSALIIVDVQNDFLPGGALAVPEGDKVIKPLNKYINLFTDKDLPIFATRDWHPPNHISFKDYGGIWPPHCIQNTDGAMFAEELRLPDSTIIISKAFKKDRDAYSGFQETTLDSELRRLGVRRVFIGGLATDYCVRATVLDALRLGYESVLLLDAVKGVDVKPGDSERAVREMIRNGAIAIEIDDILIE
jgi:nicotinamidase/pyrazinamidase